MNAARFRSWERLREAREGGSLRRWLIAAIAGAGLAGLVEWRARFGVLIIDEPLALVGRDPIHFGAKILAGRVLILRHVPALQVGPHAVNDKEDILVLDEEIVVGVVTHRADASLGALLRLGLRNLSALEFVMLLFDDFVGDLADGSQFVLAAGVDVARVDPRQRRDHRDEREAEQNDDSQKARADRPEEATKLRLFRKSRHRMQPLWRESRAPSWM